MMQDRTYQIALILAVALHVLLAITFMVQPHHARPVMQLEASKATKAPAVVEEEIVQAVSVNSQELSRAVEKLKAERLAKAKAEKQRQQKLLAEANALKAKRVSEERRLKKLRAENARAAEKRKKEAAAEQQRIKDMQKQKLIEAKKLEQLKKEQASLEKQKAEEKARIDAENRARMAGVIDKYKALILGAISKEWIVPDQVDQTLSSRFKIRLAPNGTVLDVQLTRSSGDVVLDRSAEAAIYKASPLPVPGEPDVFRQFREISLTVRPEHVRG